MQSLNLPGDIAVMIIVYKMQLKRYTPGRDKLGEIIRLIKILSNPGVDKINYYVNMVIEKYLSEFRMTPGMFMLNEEQVYLSQELAPELLKYDCFAGNDRIWVKKEKFAIKLYEGHIIIVFPGGLHVWFFIRNKHNEYELNIDFTKKMSDSNETRAGCMPGLKLLKINEIVDNMIEWAKRLKELDDEKIDTEDIWFYSSYLQPGETGGEQVWGPMLTPGPLSDLIKRIKLRDE